MLTHWRESAESIFLQKLLWEEGQVCFTIGNRWQNFSSSCGLVFMEMWVT